MAEGNDLALAEWLGVLGQLWKAVGKPLDKDRLKVYRMSLEDVPLGLLEVAVRRVIRENVFNVVPPPGMVWEAVRQELGTLTGCSANPRDLRLGIERWKDRLWEDAMWRRTVNRSSAEIEEEIN